VPKSYWIKSWIVPFTTSVGVGRKSGFTNPPYDATHHAPITRIGATNPRTKAVEAGNGLRIANELIFLLVIFSIALMLFILRCQNHLNVGTSILLTTGF